MNGRDLALSLVGAAALASLAARRGNPNVTIDSDAFRRWFGKSKAVDADGQPLVVYHGTRQGVFSSFDPTLRGASTGSPSAKMGFFFTPQRSAAEFYAGLQFTRDQAVQGAVERMKKDLKARGYPISLNTGYRSASLLTVPVIAESMSEPEIRAALKRRLRENIASSEASHARFAHDVGNEKRVAKWKLKAITSGEANLFQARAMLPLLDRMIDEESDIAAPSNMRGWKDKHVFAVYLRAENPMVFDDHGRRAGGSFATRIQKAHDRGHDSVLVLNTEDPDPMDVWIVFDPAQIKSATDNAGTFDPGSPSLHLNRVVRGSPNAKGTPIALLPNRFTPEGWAVVAGVDNDGTEQIHLTVHVDHEDGERYLVGEISISELPAADESDCRGLKRLARSNPRIPAWHVNIVQLEPAFIGHGLGVSLYLLAAQAAVQWARGPIILTRDECHPGGETSEMADHAWRRLALRPEVAKVGRPQTWSANAEAVLVTPASLGIPVTSRLQDALSHWKGETSTMRLHMNDERAKEPMPGSKNGRERRLEAAALLFELERYARPCPKPLYRGSMHTPRGANSWTTSRRVAEGFTRGENKRLVARNEPPTSVVHELPAGTRGLRIADYISVDYGESEWIVQTPAGSLAIAG